MAEHFYRALTGAGERKYFRVTVELQGDHHRSICVPVDSDGSAVPDADAVAPAFYGVTPDQALRRMVQVLENSYDEVEAVKAESRKPKTET